MSTIDISGNMVHTNYTNKAPLATGAKKRVPRKKKVKAFFDSDDESEFVIMLPKKQDEGLDQPEKVTDTDFVVMLPKQEEQDPE